MLHPLLEKYIPSRSYVEFLKGRDASFTGFETAAILHQIDLPPEQEMAAYRELMGEVKGEGLRRQLSEELARMERAMELFKTGGEGVAFMTSPCRSDDDGMLGLAANYEAAYELGIRSGEAFEIKKYRLMTEYPRNPVLRKSYLNPYMSDSEDWRDSVKTHEEHDFAWDIGEFSFQKDGTLLYMYSSEEEERLSDAEHMDRYYSPKRFTNAYIDYPNPFECGDIVTFVHPRGMETFGEIGIVNTSQADWANFCQKIKDGLYVDQSDACLTVEWLTKDGRFSHSHNPFIFLERFVPDKSDPRHDLIEAGSEMMRGEGSLEWFTGRYEAYKKREEKK